MSRRLRSIVSAAAGGALALVLAGSMAPSVRAQTQAQPAPSAMQLSLDAPDPGISIENGQRVTVGGWAAEPGIQGGGIVGVEVYLDGVQQNSGTLLGRARLGITRQDVATIFGRPDWASAGFTFDWIPRTLTQGNHVLYVVARAANGDSNVATVAFTSCGCGVNWTPSITHPAVTSLGPLGYELDTGGPGVFIDRNDDSPTGR